MSIEQLSLNNNLSVESGLSGKEKKQLRALERIQKSEEQKEKNRNHENYGDIKVSRRIPKEIAKEVADRDYGRDFGRPNHTCERPGPPHHITHFEKFLNLEIEGDPHTPENLECPCSDCHKLAHEMGIPSGTSIEEFFREKFSDQK